MPPPSRERHVEWRQAGQPSGVQSRLGSTNHVRLDLVDVLAVLGTVIGAAGLVVATVAFRRDAKSADRISVLEEARRRDELAPNFTVDYRVQKGGERMLEVVLRGPQDLDEVRFELAFSGSGTVPIAAVSIDRDPHPITEGPLGPMRMGQARLLLVALEPNRTRPDQRMVLRSRNGGDSWQTTVDFEVPG